MWEYFDEWRSMWDSDEEPAMQLGLDSPGLTDLTSTEAPPTDDVLEEWADESEPGPNLDEEIA